MNKSELLQTVVELHNNNGLQIVTDQKILPDSWKKSTGDYVSYQNVGDELTPFSVIVTTSSFEEIGVTYARRVVKRIVDNSAFWFGLVVDKEIYLYSATTDDSLNFTWKKITEGQLSSLISALINKKFDETKFSLMLLENISNIKKGSKNEAIFAEIFIGLLDEFDYRIFGRTISITLEQQFEIITRVLKAANIELVKEFCRYTSSKSLHRILNDKQESMCGLAVMNDKSEGFYLDQCVSPSSSIALWRHAQSEIDAYNDVFITSLCKKDMSDNLTMWRLYGGDDGDGVCLEYQIDDEYVKNNKNFFLLPVLYGNNNNLLIQLFRFIYRFPLMMGFQFVLSCKNVIRYFVKPEGFKIEKEQRLLFARDKSLKGKIKEAKWIFNESKKIFHPIQELELKSKGDKVYSPLILKRIILGPKCSESSINKVQLISWLNRLPEFKGVSVEESSINFYR